LDKEAFEKRINVPPEIQEQGAAVVANYLEEIEKAGAKNLNEARIIILGDKGAGKTSLACRLINPDTQMPTETESTPGVDITLWKPENIDANIHLWDFAGHTVTHAVHQFFLSERCLYIIVYDGRSENRNRLEYWLNNINNFGGNSEVFIVVNKRDKHSPDIPVNRLKEDYPIAGFYNFSIKDEILMQNVVNNYNISPDNLIMGGQGNLIDTSVHTVFNFYNCNLTLQGHLNDLAGSLRRKGEVEEAEALEDAAKALSEAEQCETPNEVKKKGIMNKLKRIVADLRDENSKLYKTVKGIKHGISIAQDIYKCYSEIAQWVGPQ